jgi:phosphoglycerol transferase
LSATLYTKRFTPLLATVILVAMTIFSFYKLGIPYRLDRYFHPDQIQNRELVKANVGISDIGQQEIYGLKLVQLLLPVRGHRIEAFKRANELYTIHHTVNENFTATLGVIGSAGFIALLGILLVPGIKKKPFHELAVLNITSFLLATIGGFSSVISILAWGFLGSSSSLVQARSYNRISVFIAFFSFLCIGLIITKYLPVQEKKARFISCAISLVILGFGLYDQIPPRFITDFQQSNLLKESYASDKAFINDIEHQIQKNAKVFQLPFVVHHWEWPKELSYYTESLKPYLHSKNLKWTYGGGKGSKQVQWYRTVSSLCPQKMLHQLAMTGFSGIYIDRTGFEDNGANLEKSLTELTGIKPFVSMDERYAFFNITGYVRKLLNDTETKPAINLLE